MLNTWLSIFLEEVYGIQSTYLALETEQTLYDINAATSLTDIVVLQMIAASC